MEKDERKEKRLQWHPAFYAGIQIELQDEAADLTFENEHQLGTKPKEVDVLIIKKEKDISIEKNIGRIFRIHNIIEYKDPEDYISIDDFYKVIGYALFYKSDTPKVDSIKIDELTVSFFCNRYPRKLIKHLESRQRYQILNQNNGIYEILGADFPIQIVLTSKLDWEENKWLKSLTTTLQTGKAEELAEEYNENRKNPLYKSIMDIVVRANKEKFEEVKGMCEALRELFKEELEEQLEEQLEERLEERLAKAKKDFEETYKEIGREIGEKIGKEQMSSLIIQLSKLGRTSDILKAAEDKEYQNQLLMEFNL